jgi:hypothetical protein
MDGTIRVRTAAWFATAVVISVFATLLVMQEWRADAAPGDSDATWVAAQPCRLFDYRPGKEPLDGKKTPLAAGAPATQQVTGNIGNCKIPTTGVVAVSMNVTVVQSTAQSNLRLYPADAAGEPVVSNLNWLAGDSATANKVDVKLSSTGQVKVAVANGTVNVIGDVVGYYTNTTLKALQTQIDAKADPGAAVTGPGALVPATLIVQSKFVPESVVTPSAGQLLISKFGSMSITCTSGGRLYLQVVDDVPLKSSVVYKGDGTSWEGQITGTTESSIPADAHEVAIGAQCKTPANYTGGASWTKISISSVTVIPSNAPSALATPLAADLDAGQSGPIETCTTERDVTTCVDEP